MIVLCQVRYGHLVHGTFTWLYIYFLVYMNNQNTATVRRILFHISAAHKEKAKNNQFLLAKYQRAFPVASQIIQRLQQNIHVHKSTFHRYQQMNLYLEYYQINIFDIFKVNYSFLFKSFLFVLNFIVLITQTN